MKLQLHPDGIIYVRNPDDSTSYAATVGDFASDSRQLPLPTLPAGMVSFVYDDDEQVMTYYDRKGNAFPIEGKTPVPECVTILGSSAALIDAKAAREGAAIAAEQALLSAIAEGKTVVAMPVTVL